MAETTPKHSGYTIINGSTTGSNGSKVNTWIEYKVTSQSIANNTSTVDIYLYARANTSGLSTAWLYSGKYGSITFDGTAHEGATISGYDFRGTGIYNEFAHYTEIVTHNTNGQKNITLAASWNKGTSPSTYITGGSVPSTTVTLPTIPRYATVSQSLNSKTETNATIKWSADSTIDYVWYSTDNGLSWSAVGSVNTNSGSYTINGLSANTAYNIKTRVRRGDSQLTTDSSALSVTTYDYPYATIMPNFTIGDSFAIQFYNPLGRPILFYLIANGTQISDTWTTSGTSYTGFNAASTATQLYATIPNAKTASYSVKVVYGASTITSAGGTMSANASACAPEIATAAYLDTKAETILVTGDDQKIIRNQSIVQYSATGIAAKNSATIASVRVSVNGTSYTMAVNGSSATGGNATINSGTNVTATISVTDSRGYITTKTVDVQMLDWALPSAIITLQRQSNYYTTTDIKVNAQYSSLDGNNTIAITYKARKTGESAWSITGTLTNNVAATFSADNEYSWDVQIILTDKFGTTTYNQTITRGMPLVYFDRLRLSVGINCFPQNDRSLEINGETIADIVYPVGSIYMSMNATSPAQLFGGSWTQIADSFLLPATQSGQTGGEETHTLTAAEMPSHNHTIWDNGGSGSNSYHVWATTWKTTANSSAQKSSSINWAGGGEAHNNMPPYITVYCWQRVG